MESKQSAVVLLSQLNSSRLRTVARDLPLEALRLSKSGKLEQVGRVLFGSASNNTTYLVQESYISGKCRMVWIRP